MGQKVYVRPTLSRYTTKWTDGVVTHAGNRVTVEVNGIPRHVADVRTLPVNEMADTTTDEKSLDDECENTRPQRTCNPPLRFNDYVM